MQSNSDVPHSSKKGIFLGSIHFIILQAVEGSRTSHQEHLDLLCITHDEKGAKAFKLLMQAELVEIKPCGHVNLTLLGVACLAEHCLNAKAKVFVHLMPSVPGQ